MIKHKSGILSLKADPNVSRVKMSDCKQGKVQIWHYEMDRDVREENSYIHTLNREELDRAARYRFKKDKRRFIVGRATLRVILACYSECEPQEIQFGIGKHGKPFIKYPKSAAEVKFSASKSHGLGAVAVTKCSELGFDIEKVCPSADHELIALREFSAEERAWFLSVPQAERQVAFFEIWTCKEAYLKGKGFGLSVPLNQFTVMINQNMLPRLTSSDIDRSDPERWSLHRPIVEPGYVASLAVDGDCHVTYSKRWEMML